MDPAVLAVIRRFPDRRWVVQRLALRNEAFRSICADLVEAEIALERWESSPLPAKEERCAEYRLLVAGLEDELRAALDAAADGK